MRKLLLLLISTQFLSSCAYLFYDEDETATPTVKNDAAIKTDPSVPIKIVEAKPMQTDRVAEESPNVKAAHAEIEKQISKIQDGQPNAADAPNEMAVDTTLLGSAKVVGVDPEKALGWLKNGNTRFVKGRFRADGQSVKDVKRLAPQQRPHTVVITCSDSRLPPEILFDQKLGEIFVVRTFGGGLDPISVGSVEYALSQLGTRHILVLGHTYCGAISAACANLAGADAGSENLNALMTNLQNHLQEFRGKTFSKAYVDESWAHTEGVSKELSQRSGLIALMLKNRNIKVSSAIYDIETGRVHFK